MWFVGLLIGGMLGAIAWGWEGAATLGFFGFLAGLILGNRRSASAPAPVAKADRLSALEQRVMALETRLGRFEKGESAGTVEPAANIRKAEAADPAALGEIEAPLTPAAPLAAAAASTRSIAEPPRVAQAAAPAAPQPPSRPNFIVRWFTEGNAIVRIGVTILFVGVAFLVKYAADHSLLPIEFRLMGAAAGGIALLVVGWRLREKRAGYALTLQGAGVAVLYLTLFGAFRLWGLVPAALAFPLLIAIAAFSAFLAIRQDSLALAVAGTAGGFLAPILASTGGGSHVMLFGYYAVLNAGILTIAWHKAWRPLNLVGFAFTFVIGLMWGARFYRPEVFSTTEPFLVLFFLMYVLIAVLFAHREAPRIAHYVDGTLIFGVPLVAFGLQYALVKDTEYGLAISALVLGAFYLGLAQWLLARKRDTLRLLTESFLALGVVFATLAIPLALDTRWTSAAWALEGAGIVWIGVRQQRLLARLFGLLLQFIAGAAFLHALTHSVGPLPLMNSVFIGALLLVAGGLVTYRMLSREASVSKHEFSLASFWFGWALLWWVFAGLREIDRFILDQYQPTLALLFFAATAMAASLAWRSRNWLAGEWPVLGLLPVLALVALWGALDHAHPFVALGWLVWPVALVVHYLNLRRHEAETPRAALALTHAGTLLLVAAIGAWELHWLAEEFGLRKSAWSVAAVLVVPCLVLLAACAERFSSRWPMQPYAATIFSVTGIPLIAAFWLWTFYANVSHDGTSAPLPYLPLLNALDLGHVLIALAGLAWWRRYAPAHADVAPLLRVAAGAAGFVWLNAVLLRSIHHWADVPYRAASLWNSMLVQASVSIFWTVLSLSLMLLATRKGLRAVWMLGATLMAAVVAKLLFIDFSSIDGIERIVSFIGVGVLMAVIGYFSPLPPKEKS